MKFYFAPIEGVTGYIYRNAHRAFFNNIDKYFTPFIAANQNASFRSGERNDILPENNPGLAVIPQLLTNNTADFISTSKKLKEFGYEEINLNLGCPSGTVVSKNKGSGFLSKPEDLDVFFDAVFSRSITKISVKTRIGKDHPDEFYRLVEIFNKYPMEELIIHPRIQKDFYKNTPNLAVFRDALALSKNPVCYNGDLFTTRDLNAFSDAFPDVGTLMLGRGLLTNPGLVGGLKTDRIPDKAVLREFHDKIYEDYKKVLFGERNVLFRMKELWSYMIGMFSDNMKYAKKIKKSERFCDYEEAVSKLFREQDIQWEDK